MENPAFKTPVSYTSTILRNLRNTESEAILAVYTHFEVENGAPQDAMRIQIETLRALIAGIDGH